MTTIIPFGKKVFNFNFGGIDYLYTYKPRCTLSKDDYDSGYNAGYEKALKDIYKLTKNNLKKKAFTIQVNPAKAFDDEDEEDEF